MDFAKLWQDIQKNFLNFGALKNAVSKNVGFVLVFVGLIVAAFLTALLFEIAAKKRLDKKEKVLTTRKVAAIGVLSAISLLLFLFDFPIPFLIPNFYKMDFSDLPALFGGFAFGPVAAVLIEFVKILLKLVIKGTSTAFVGDFANFITSCCFVLSATILYWFHKTRKTALLSCVIGTVCLTVAGSFLNAFFLLPAFAELYGMPLDKIVAMGTKVNPAIQNVTTFVLFAVAPFNLLKGVAVSAITLLIYKPLKRGLKF